MQNIDNQEVINIDKKPQKAILPQLFRNYGIIGTVTSSLTLIYGLFVFIIHSIYGDVSKAKGFFNTIKAICSNTYNRSGGFVIALGVILLAGSVVLFSLSKVTGKFINTPYKQLFNFIKPLKRLRIVYTCLLYEALVFGIITFYTKMWLMMILFLLTSAFFAYIGRKIKNIISGIYLINKQKEPEKKRRIRFW